jgi:hypothetical protein
MTGHCAHSICLVALSDAVRAVAPDFVTAHLAQAWLFILARDPMLAERIEALITTASTLPMNQREQGHLAALQQAVNGQLSAALMVLDRHLLR